MKLVPPADLFTLHQHFVVEEALSVIRHDLRNKLGSVRNASFYIGRKLQKAAPTLATEDPRVPQFLALISTELDAADKEVQSRLPAPEAAHVMTASVLLRRIHDSVTMPPSIQLVIEPATESRVRVGPDEATLALFCLLENAVDALDGRGGTIRLRVRTRDGRAAFEVEDDGPGFAAGAQQRALEPFFTTRTGRMGIGLNIARRIAARWDATIELAPIDHGVRASLVSRLES